MASDELETVNELLRGVELGSATLEERRAMMDSSGGHAAEGTTVEPVDAGGVPAEWVIAPDVDDRVVVHLHGGAYHLGSLASSRRRASLVSAAARARVLNVGYRLAPEHPFPAAVLDAVAAVRWLWSASSAPSRTALAGDSAGGGLVLATLLALRDAGGPLPAAGVAISPVTDLEATGESMTTRADVDLLLRPDGMKEAADLYLAGQDPRHPYASPLHGDLAGLPPLLIQVGDAEVLLDDSTRFAARAEQAGVDVTLEVWPEMPHVWHAFAGFLPEADRADARIGAWIQARLP
jgi:acetyl esterase/lipase